ncbi:hypothetical protein HGQ17_08980 [Nesterenkonia sp. MY13]|uniref:Uncharacterized protein n=1 Tax=Nesterenkonia sedimenti TaxID=1463632 RepID=A0A7X8TK12_9MICC|nr:hypothetical protein [Nesterenkonia sedimenti]NLS10128.1 hypothetical protein [Nesterenkonia sedimenti]
MWEPVRRRCTPPRLFAIAISGPLLLAGCAGESSGPGEPTETTSATPSTTIFVEQSDYDDVPTSTVELPDGRDLEVQAQEALLRDDVTVTFREFGDSDGGMIVATSEAEEPVLISAEIAMEDGPADGVLLLASPLDVGYERGEWEYAEPPRTPTVLLPPGGVAPVSPAGTGLEILCVEVVSERDTSPQNDFEADVPGLRVDTLYRSSTGTLEMACSELDSDPAEVTTETWAYERLNIPVLTDEYADLAVDIESELTETDDSLQLDMTVTALEDITLHAPGTRDAFFVVLGDAQWIPDISAEERELAAGEDFELTEEFSPRLRSRTDSLTVCFEAHGEEIATRACHDVEDW